jgi:hypothetical protein
LGSFLSGKFQFRTAARSDGKKNNNISEMKSGSLLFISVFLMWEKGGGAVLELWGEKMCEMYQSLNPK